MHRVTRLWNATQAAALLLTVVWLLGLIVMAVVDDDPADAAMAQVRTRPRPERQVTPPSREFAGTRHELRFGQPEIALP
jgi:hypothetical protein